MDYAALANKLQSHRGEVELEPYAQLSERQRSYPVFRAVVPGEPWVVVTAGFHGEEPAGPLTLAEHLSDVVRYAKERGVGLRIYPCVNPSGFETGTRYNASGERPNNDFLRYEVSPGVWVGELPDGAPFTQWKPFDQGPKETRALLTELEAQPTPFAALDIHQDNYMSGSYAYAYVFGDAAPFSALMERATRASQVAAAVRAPVDDAHRTDSSGLVWYHDGSVTDYFHRRGARFTAALETTTRTPLQRCHQVNLAWIRGFIDLAADGRAKAR